MSCVVGISLSYVPREISSYVYRIIKDLNAMPSATVEYNLPVLYGENLQNIGDSINEILRQNHQYKSILNLNME